MSGNIVDQVSNIIFGSNENSPNETPSSEVPDEPRYSEEVKIPGAFVDPSSSEYDAYHYSKREGTGMDPSMGSEIRPEAKSARSGSWSERPMKRPDISSATEPSGGRVFDDSMISHPARQVYPGSTGIDEGKIKDDQWNASSSGYDADQGWTGSSTIGDTDMSAGDTGQVRQLKPESSGYEEHHGLPSDLDLIQHGTASYALDETHLSGLGHVDKVYVDKPFPGLSPGGGHLATNWTEPSGIIPETGQIDAGAQDAAVMKSTETKHRGVTDWHPQAGGSGFNSHEVPVGIGGNRSGTTHMEGQMKDVDLGGSGFDESKVRGTGKVGPIDTEKSFSGTGPLDRDLSSIASHNAPSGMGGLTASGQAPPMGASGGMGGMSASGQAPTMGASGGIGGMSASGQMPTMGPSGGSSTGRMGSGQAKMGSSEPVGMSGSAMSAQVPSMSISTTGMSKQGGMAPVEVTSSGGSSHIGMAKSPGISKSYASGDISPPMNPRKISDAGDASAGGWTGEPSSRSDGLDQPSGTLGMTVGATAAAVGGDLALHQRVCRTKDGLINSNIQEVKPGDMQGQDMTIGTTGETTSKVSIFENFIFAFVV
jgi:hypothetical protein